MIIIAPGFLIFLTLSKRPLDSWGGFATSSLLQTKLECFLLKPLLDFSIKWQVISMYCQILVGRLALLHYKILCYALLRTLYYKKSRIQNSQSKWWLWCTYVPKTIVVLSSAFFVRQRIYYCMYDVLLMPILLMHKKMIHCSFQFSQQGELTQ